MLCFRSVSPREVIAYLSLKASTRGIAVSHVVIGEDGVSVNSDCRRTTSELCVVE